MLERMMDPRLLIIVVGAVALLANLYDVALGIE